MLFRRAAAVAAEVRWVRWGAVGALVAGAMVFSRTRSTWVAALSLGALGLWLGLRAGEPHLRRRVLVLGAAAMGMALLVPLRQPKPLAPCLEGMQ